MFTTVAYQVLTAAAAATDLDMALVNDPSVTNLNNHPVFPVPLWLQMAYLASDTATRGRMSSPRLRPIARPLIHPVDPLSANAPSQPVIFTEWWRRPLMLNPVEELQVLLTKTSANAEQAMAVVNVGDNQRNVPPGDMYVIRGTSTNATTLLQWNPGALTLDDTLQVGRYSIVGLHVVNATAIGCRLIFPASSSMNLTPWARPGTVTQPSDTNLIWSHFRYGQQGEYGQFESFALPQTEVVGRVAVNANTQTFLDIVDVRVGARG